MLGRRYKALAGQMNRALIHENRKETWRTPRAIFDPLHTRFAFVIDCAANRRNHLLPMWIGPGSTYCDNFLKLHADQLPDGVCWINPPYGASLAPMTRHIAWLATYGARFVALLPASVDVAWYWSNVHHAASSRWGRRGRIQFEPRTTSGNPGPSLLALYNVSADYIDGWLRL